MCVLFIENFFLYFQLQSSQNKVYLNASTLMLNINEKEFDQTVDDMKKKRWNSDNTLLIMHDSVWVCLQRNDSIHDNEKYPLCQSNSIIKGYFLVYRHLIVF